MKKRFLVVVLLIVLFMIKTPNIILDQTSTNFENLDQNGIMQPRNDDLVKEECFPLETIFNQLSMIL